MIHDAIIAIHGRDGLHLCHKMCVAILELACAWNHQHPLKVERALVPPWTFLVQFRQYHIGHVSVFGGCGVIRMVAECLLLLEVLHGLRLGLDNNEINARTNFIAFGEEDVARGIFTNVLLQFGSHSYLADRRQKINGLIDTCNKRLAVKIPQI